MRGSGLPRARGDRPDTAFATADSGPSAPRTRGSTLEVDGGATATLVCPAHAGIDPEGPAMRSSTTGLPRARGDRVSGTPIIPTCGI